MSLSPESTIAEAFAFLQGANDEGVGAQVVPMTIKQQADDTQLMILVKGEHEMASVIMAELMSKVDDLFDTSKQREAVKDEPRIVTS